MWLGADDYRIECVSSRNGILSYLIPAPYGTTEQDLPAHPCLRIEMVC